MEAFAGAQASANLRDLSGVDIGLTRTLDIWAQSVKIPTRLTRPASRFAHFLASTDDGADSRLWTRASKRIRVNSPLGVTYAAFVDIDSAPMRLEASSHAL